MQYTETVCLQKPSSNLIIPILLVLFFSDEDLVYVLVFTLKEIYYYVLVTERFCDVQIQSVLNVAKWKENINDLT